MKVAVCLSVIVRGQIAFNIARLKEAFPYDFFYGTYTKREEDLHWFLGMGNNDYYLFENSFGIISIVLMGLVFYSNKSNYHNCQFLIDRPDILHQLDLFGLHE